MHLERETERPTNGNLHLQSGKPLGLTPMRPISKREVLTRVQLAMDIEPIWIREYIWITIGRPDGANDSFASLDVLHDQPVLLTLTD